MPLNASLRSDPLVSVVIPVYNHEHYIEQALNSVLHQTYPHLEIIILDDGSQDKSVQTIERWLQRTHYPATRQLTFIKQSNQGAHHAINRGLSMAKGDFLTILNSDDYYHPKRIQLLVESTLAAQAQFAFSYVTGINEKNVPLPAYHWWPRWYEKTMTHLFHFPTIGFMLLQENIAVSTGNLFFSKELYQAVGPFRHLRLSHDHDFIVRALTLVEPLLVREKLYFYRLHSTNTQHQVKHLLQIERQEIYRNYLTSIFSQPPQNRLAPCHWYWPLEFARLRLKLKMDRGLDHYILRFPAKTKKKMPMHVAVDSKLKSSVYLVSHDLSLTGAPKLVVDLALCLKQHGYQPLVFALKDGPMRGELEKEGIKVHAPSGSLFRRGMHLVWAACSNHVPLTIVNSIASWPFVCLMAIFHPFCTLKWYVHETSAPQALDGRISHYLFNWFKRKPARRVWFGSKSTQEAWKRRGIEGEVVYWSGLVAQMPIQKSEAPIKRLLAVGTASARKGTYYLIEAFLYCLEKEWISQDVTLTIIGFPDGDHPNFIGLEDLILRVVTSPFKNRVHLVGALTPEQIEDYYVQADLFIQASLSECMPIALLTAMAKGLPIITTHVDGCAEAIRHQWNGYLCLPYDVHSLARAMMEAIHHPKESRAMGALAQKTFNERFSIEATQSIILDHLTRS